MAAPAIKVLVSTDTLSLIVALRKVSVLPVSPVVGLHVGPAVGVAYECAHAISGKLTGPKEILTCAS